MTTNEFLFSPGETVRIGAVDPGEYMTTEDIEIHGIPDLKTGNKGIVQEAMAAIHPDGPVYAVTLENGETWDFYEKELLKA